MLFEIHAMPGKGADRIAIKFGRMGGAALNAKPAMEAISVLMMRAIRATFDSQGRRGGGSWKRDSILWLERKQRLNLDPRIGFATHALVDSVTVPGAAHQRRKVTRNRVVLGTSLPYAATQQRHRPFVKFLPGDHLAARAIVREHLMGAFRV